MRNPLNSALIAMTLGCALVLSGCSDRTEPQAASPSSPGQPLESWNSQKSSQVEISLESWDEHDRENSFLRHHILRTPLPGKEEEQVIDRFQRRIPTDIATGMNGRFFKLFDAISTGSHIVYSYAFKNRCHVASYEIDGPLERTVVHELPGKDFVHPVKITLRQIPGSTEIAFAKMSCLLSVSGSLDLASGKLKIEKEETAFLSNAE